MAIKIALHDAKAMDLAFEGKQEQEEPSIKIGQAYTKVTKEVGLWVDAYVCYLLAIIAKSVISHYIHVHK